jgi:hypothetical protein
MSSPAPSGGGGYGKPPKEHQWRKGESGNPRGRPRRNTPKGSAPHVFNEFIFHAHAELSRSITINENGLRSEVSAEQAVIRSVIHKALKGDPRAQKLALELSKHIRQERTTCAAEMVQLVSKYHLEWLGREAEARQQGLPVPLPRPEHFSYSLERGELEITGPTKPAQELAWNSLKEALKVNEMCIDDARETLLRDPSSQWASRLLSRLNRNRLKLLRKVPPGWDWREELQR